ncbi:MAG TPA: ABC transporter ATP-binding protein [Acidimicrobiia bacterium]|jgi:putative ABC transport system ATP-binding protein
MTPPLLQVDAVSKTYREHGVDTPVLRGATLTLERGTTTSLVGASGSGKTTLIGLIAGLLVPDSGAIVVEGKDITALDDSARARLRARQIGVVMQSGNLIPFLTARENVELAIDLAEHTQRDHRAVDLLDDLGLEDRLHHLPRRLSGGETQRVAVAVALANEPDLLLADEVTGELDSESADQVMDIVFGACRDRGLAVLFVTHNEELAARAERQLRLEDGEVRPA